MQGRVNDRRSRLWTLTRQQPFWPRRGKWRHMETHCRFPSLHEALQGQVGVYPHAGGMDADSYCRLCKPCDIPQALRDPYVCSSLNRRHVQSRPAPFVGDLCCTSFSRHNLRSRFKLSPAPLAGELAIPCAARRRARLHGLVGDASAAVVKWYATVICSAKMSEHIAACRRMNVRKGTQCYQCPYLLTPNSGPSWINRSEVQGSRLRFWHDCSCSISRSPRNGEQP